MIFSRKSSSIEPGHEVGDDEIDPMLEWMVSAEGQAFEPARQLAEEAPECVRVDGAEPANNTLDKKS